MRSNENAECQKCGAQRGNYQYCINCGHDSADEVSAAAAQSSPASGPTSNSASASGASVDASTQTVIDVFSSPEAKNLAEQLAALVAAQSHPVNSARQPADVAVAERSTSLPSTRGPVDSATDAPQVAQSSSIHRTRPNVAVLMAAGLLSLALAGIALTRAFQDQPEDLRPSTGALVSAEEAPPALIDAAPERVVCWDGSKGTLLSACGTPSGLRGLAWVFPSIQPEECEALGSLGRPQAWRCPVNTGTPDEASIVYGELFSVAEGLNHYNRLYENGLGVQKIVKDRYVWKAERRSVRKVWQRSAMYVAEPWSVHVESETKRGAKAAFKSVEFRAPEQLAGLGPTD